MEFHFPGDQAGLFIGRGWKNIHSVEQRTDTKIKIRGDKKDITQNGRGKITGTKENCEKALAMLLNAVLAKITKQISSTTDTVALKGNRECGLVIGKGGKTLQAIEFLSGAKVKIAEEVEKRILNLPRQCIITGTSEGIKKAKELIEKAQQGEDITRPAVMLARFNVLVQIFTEYGFGFPTLNLSETPFML